MNKNEEIEVKKEVNKVMVATTISSCISWMSVQ